MVKLLLVSSYVHRHKRLPRHVPLIFFIHKTKHQCVPSIALSIGPPDVFGLVVTVMFDFLEEDLYISLIRAGANHKCKKYISFWMISLDFGN